MSNFIVNKISTFLQREEGATAVEYAVMMALIIIVGLVAIFTFGDFQRQIWFNTSDRLNEIP